MTELFSYLFHNNSKIILLTWQHCYLFMISTSIAVVSGIAVGVFVTGPGREKIGKAIIAITGAFQAIPPVAVVALAFIAVGIGAVPSIIALILYSITPIVFNTASGLLSIPASVLESGKGLGFTDRQILFKIRIPLAMPIILAGVRSAVTINIGTATIASIIGGGGLGDLIFMGLKLYRLDMILAGAILTALLAVIADFLLERVQKAVVSPGII